MNIAPGIDIATSYASEKGVGLLFSIMEAENCRNVLEVGSKQGRMLLRWGKILPKGSRICSIDLPGGAWGHKSSGSFLQATIDKLQRDGFDSHVLLANSHSDKAIEWARALGPYDLVFIDGDHSYAAVMKDWKNYSEMARIVAFHDISPEVCGGKVAQAYAKICVGQRHEECLEIPGMGVVWL